MVHMLQMEKLRLEGDRELSGVILTELGLEPRGGKKKEPRSCLPVARSF